MIEQRCVIHPVVAGRSLCPRPVRIAAAFTGRFARRRGSICFHRAFARNATRIVPGNRVSFAVASHCIHLTIEKRVASNCAVRFVRKERSDERTSNMSSRKGKKQATSNIERAALMDGARARRPASYRLRYGIEVSILKSRELGPVSRADRWARRSQRQSGPHRTPLRKDPKSPSRRVSPPSDPVRAQPRAVPAREPVDVSLGDRKEHARRVRRVPGACVRDFDGVLVVKLVMFKRTLPRDPGISRCSTHKRTAKSTRPPEGGRAKRH